MESNQSSNTYQSLQDLLDNPELFQIIGGIDRSRLVSQLNESEDLNDKFICELLTEPGRYVGDYLVYEYREPLNDLGKFSFEILKDYCFYNWDGDVENLSINSESNNKLSGNGTYRYMDIYVDGVSVRYIFNITHRRHELIMITETLVFNANKWAYSNLKKYILQNIIKNAIS